MQGRAVGLTAGRADFVLRYPPNWTAVWFFLVLGMLHLANGATAFVNGRWEGYLSLVLAVVFLGVSLLCWRLRAALHVTCSEHRIRMSQGFGWFRMDRSIRFADVRAVRLTLAEASKDAGSSLEIICDRESIECPPTGIPRQLALCLAIAMNARLVKVYEDTDAPARHTEPDMVSPPES